MTKIIINGYASFDAWREAGYPGARSFNADGTVKEPRTQLAKCRLEMCDWSMVQDGLCLHHYRMRAAARRKALRGLAW